MLSVECCVAGSQCPFVFEGCPSSRQPRVPENLIVGFLPEVGNHAIEAFEQHIPRYYLNVGCHWKHTICVMAMGHDAGACFDGILHSHSRCKP